MKVDLSKYLEDWYKDDPAKNIYPGPVITISRELGCPAKTLACSLAKKLDQEKTKKSKEQPWRWISKEILDESAKQLNVDRKAIFDQLRKADIVAVLVDRGEVGLWVGSRNGT